jgi:hypothetical protein
MAGARKERLPYQITLRGFLAVTTAFTLSLCLFWYGAESLEASVLRAMAREVPNSMASSGNWWALLAGASFMGGALGAAIGQVFRDEKGGAASMGAFVGALAGPPIVLILIAALLFGIWMSLGCPSA